MYDANDAREQLQDTLNRLEYQTYYNQSESFIARWWNNFVDWLADKLISIFKTTETSENIAEIVLVVIITLIILFIIFGLFSFTRNIHRRRKYMEQTPFSTWDKTDWTYQMHLAEAKKQEMENDYQHATRHRFLALLLYFDERGWLEKKVWKTNIDYYFEIKQGTEEKAKTFYELARTFDNVVYGEHVIGEQEYNVFRQQTLQWLEETG